MMCKLLKFKEERGDYLMPGIRVKENESFESALKRFKRQCEKAGILSEVKKRQYYEKPSEKRKRKAIEAQKRAVKRFRRTIEI